MSLIVVSNGNQIQILELDTATEDELSWGVWGVWGFEWALEHMLAKEQIMY